MTSTWRPAEIIIHNKLQNDTVTQSIIQQYPSVPINFVNDGKPTSIVAASGVLRNVSNV